MVLRSRCFMRVARCWRFIDRGASSSLSSWTRARLEGRFGMV